MQKNILVYQTTVTSTVRTFSASSVDAINSLPTAIIADLPESLNCRQQVELLAPVAVSISDEEALALVRMRYFSQNGIEYSETNNHGALKSFLLRHSAERVNSFVHSADVLRDANIILRKAAADSGVGQ